MKPKRLPVRAPGVHSGRILSLVHKTNNIHDILVLPIFVPFIKQMQQQSGFTSKASALGLSWWPVLQHVTALKRKQQG